MIDGQEASEPVLEAGIAMEAATQAGSVPFTGSVLTGNEALHVYEALCREATFAPPQNPTWIRNWVSSHSPDFVVVVLQTGGFPVFALALEIAGSGMFRTASFVGERHANGNFPAATADFLASVRPDDISIAAKALGAARPDIDLLALERQVTILGGAANPLAMLPKRSSPNLSFAVDLQGGFEQLLERTSGKHKRKRKKYRAQLRKFEEAGGYRRITAQSAAEVERLFSAFLIMKAERFRKMGIADVFVDEKTRRFFRGLFADALRAENPAYLLNGLEVGGKLRAVTGSSVGRDRIICEFGAIADDEITSLSPGEFLFFENIREACDQEFAIYDFSVGDEAYKRQWCDIETTQFDTILPLTAKGKLLASAKHASSAAKRIVKSNPALWSLVKRMRKDAGARPSQQEA